MKAFIGLGSNLGDREAMIRLALDDLARPPETTLVKASRCTTPSRWARSTSRTS
jgi:7,8-dihydro-6-hydroxymethylpterin-pyrophosphokinase